MIFLNMIILIMSICALCYLIPINNRRRRRGVHVSYTGMGSVWEFRPQPRHAMHLDRRAKLFWTIIVNSDNSYVIKPCLKYLPLCGVNYGDLTYPLTALWFPNLYLNKKYIGKWLDNLFEANVKTYYITWEYASYFTSKTARRHYKYPTTVQVITGPTRYSI